MEGLTQNAERVAVRQVKCQPQQRHHDGGVRSGTHLRWRLRLRLRLLEGQQQTSMGAGDRASLIKKKGPDSAGVQLLRRWLTRRWRRLMLLLLAARLGQTQADK